MMPENNKKTIPLFSASLARACKANKCAPLLADAIESREDTPPLSLKTCLLISKTNVSEGEEREMKEGGIYHCSQTKQ